MPNLKASNALRKRSDAAVEAFHTYYSAIWGEERWRSSLFPALSQPTRYIAVMNQFGYLHKASSIFLNEIVNAVEQENCSGTLSYLGEGEDLLKRLRVVIGTSDHLFTQPVQIKSAVEGEQLLSHWSMDFASVLAACVLQVEAGDKVLDLCAAPGGKTIVLSQMLFPQLHYDSSMHNVDNDTVESSSALHANEFDRGRQKRLQSNLHSYIPNHLFSDEIVKVLRLDGTAKSVIDDLPLGEGGYDKVLLDAPCSSERHIIHAHLAAASAGQICEEMANWKSSHTKTLAKTQIALLMTALRAVKIGGSVLYATCSLANEENDGVIERTLEAVHRERKKDPTFSWRIRVDNKVTVNAESQAFLDTITEKTRHGRIALPDHSNGGTWGPLYFCRLQKVQRKSKSTQEEAMLPAAAISDG